MHVIQSHGMGIESAARAVERLELGTRQQITDQFESIQYEREVKHGIEYAYFARRGEEYPTREGFYVMAPATVETKVRGPMAVFNQRWDAVKVETRQLAFA